LGVTGAGKFSREEAAVLDKASGIASMALRASFLALPDVDPNDGQSVLCYRSYFPAVQAAVY